MVKPEDKQRVLNEFQSQGSEGRSILYESLPSFQGIFIEFLPLLESLVHTLVLTQFHFVQNSILNLKEMF